LRFECKVRPITLKVDSYPDGIPDGSVASLGFGAKGVSERGDVGDVRVEDSVADGDSCVEDSGVVVVAVSYAGCRG